MLRAAVTKPKRLSAMAAVAVLTVVGIGAPVAISQQTFGTPSDIAYANALWSALETRGLIGPDRASPYPNKGEQPHGSIQQILAARVAVGPDETPQRVIIKANHRGDKATIKSVYAQPNEFHTGYAVMAKRPGYDAQNADWFWVVYNPDGKVRRFQNRALAGRLDTGNTKGCIGCHRKEGGADLEVLTRQ